MISGVVAGATLVSKPLVSLAVSAKIVRLETKGAHELQAGTEVNIYVGNPVFDGTHVVVSVISPTVFTIYVNIADIKKLTLTTGTVTYNSNRKSTDISPDITQMSVSLTTDMASQITITVSDYGLDKLRNNVFYLKQPIQVLGMQFEVASIEIQQGQGGEEVRLECRLAAVQKLKREKGRAVYRGGSATSFAADRARNVGLRFFGENSTAKSSISRVRNDKTDESTWDVLSRLAGDNQFWLFEIDGRLFFTSQQFLLGKFALENTGSQPGFLSTIVRWSPITQQPTVDRPRWIRKTKEIPSPKPHPTIQKGSTGEQVKYLQTVLKKRAGQNIVVDGVFGNQTRNAVYNLQRFFKLTVNGIVGAQTWAAVDFLASGLSLEGGGDNRYRIEPMQCPNVRRSEDTYEEMTASFQVDREVGRRLRPGMTIKLEGLPGFTSNMLISEVSWEEGTPDPVSVSARTVQVPEDATERAKAQKKISLTGGGFSNVDFGQTFQ